MDLLVQYCSGTLTEIRLSYIDITDEMVPKMKPLLERLQTLTADFCGIGQVFLEVLPFWCQDLRELTIKEIAFIGRRALQFDCLRYPLTRLVSLSLYQNVDVRNSDVEMILKVNPQLRKIQLFNCRQLDHQIFRFVAINVPDIESLDIQGILLQPGAGKYFSQLKYLKILKLGFFRHSPNLKNILPVIQHLHEENIQLETFHLDDIDCTHHADEFIEEILKFRTLKILMLRVYRGLSTCHINQICKYSTELRSFRLFIRCLPDLEAITEMIRDAEKLEFLFLHAGLFMGTLTVDTGVYNTWAEIVENRCVKTPLNLHLSDNYNTENLTPVEARKRQLSLIAAHVEGCGF